jgi:three-Cys-motif partner protein
MDRKLRFLDNRPDLYDRQGLGSCRYRPDSTELLEMLQEGRRLSHFFEHPQGAAILKHEVLRQYLPVYAGKTGSRTSVVFLDGYAGPGRYADGSPGSPEVMVQTARALSDLRTISIRCVFVERDREHRERLQHLLLDMLDDHDSEVLDGSIEDRLGQVVEGAAGKSLFVFLDPFGLAIPFDMLVEMLRSRPRRGSQGWQPTEVLLNFSINGINRAAGRLDGVPMDEKMEKYRAARLMQLDAFLGGQWWHQPWRIHPQEGRVKALLDGYLTRLQQALPGWRPLSIAVRDRYGGPPSYYLVLLTRHAQGLWFFNNAVSLGAEKLHDFTFQQQPVLISPDLEQNWQGQIEQNVKRLLASTDGFKLEDEIQAVYGETLGLARQTHVHAAIKRLWKDGRTATDPRGKSKNLHKLVVLRSHVD